MQKTAYKIALLTIILFLSSRCADDSGVVHFGTFHSDKYYRVTVKYLKEPTTIQSYPCKRGKVRFHFNDSLLSFCSTADINLDHGSIPAGSRIYLYDNGKPENILLSADTEIQGYGISGKTRMQGYQLSFYNGGELWKFRPVSDEEIDGIFCSHKHEIELYPDGSLMCCHLARDIQGRDNHFAAGTHILLDMEGNMHPYKFPIHIAITRLMNIEEHFSDPRPPGNGGHQHQPGTVPIYTHEHRLPVVSKQEDGMGLVIGVSPPVEAIHWSQGESSRVFDHQAGL